MKLTENILTEIKETLLTVAPEAQVLLYGSQARGDARQDSDVDLLILLPDNDDRQYFVKRKLDISGHLYDLSLQLDIDISPLILMPKLFFARKTPFTSNVIREGIRL